MGQFFSDTVEEGIRLVWMSYDKEAMQKGFSLLQTAAQEGAADGYAFLARCYMGKLYVWAGGGFPVNDMTAARCLKESIQRGSAAGILFAMRSGELTPSLRKTMPLTVKEAFETILAKAKGGHPFCQYMVGNAYYWGDMLDIEGKEAMMKQFPTEEAYTAWAYPIAAEWYIKAFKGGYFFGFGNFRKIYEDGKGGITPDPSMVETWQKFAADYGDPVQQCNYGVLLHQRGDKAGALHYYDLAAVKGDAIALYNAGCFYLTGNGTPKNEERALRYFTESAQQGDCDSQCWLGTVYFYGDCGTEEDNAKAVYWLSKSAEQGCYWSYPPLAICLQEGWGTEKDFARAFYLLQKAEPHIDEYGRDFQGYVYRGLGQAYGWGLGTEEDFDRAAAYLNKGIEAGDETASDLRACFKKGFFGMGKWKRTDN